MSEEPIIDAEQLAREQAEYESRRKLEHARMIEEALQRWRETKSAKAAHEAFLESRSPEHKRRRMFGIN